MSALSKTHVLGILILSSVLIVPAFQNCSDSSFKMIESASQGGNNGLGTGDGTHSYSISQASGTLVSGTQFSVSVAGASSGSVCSWSHSLNSSGQCAVNNSGSSCTYNLNCGSGSLSVLVSVTDPKGVVKNLSSSFSIATGSTGPVNETIPMTITYEVAAGTGMGNWGSAANPIEVFVGQKFRFKNSDTIQHQIHSSSGTSPFPHGNAVAAGATSPDYTIAGAYNSGTSNGLYEHLYDDGTGTKAKIFLKAYDGAALYASTCQGCHGALANSDIGSQSRFVNAIKLARTTKTPMVNSAAVQALTQRQIEAIAYALGDR